MLLAALAVPPSPTVGPPDHVATGPAAQIAGAPPAFARRPWGPAAPLRRTGPPVTVWTAADGLQLRPRGLGPLDPATVDAEADAARLQAVLPTAGRVIVALDRIAPFPWRDRVVEVAVGCRPVEDLACPGGVVEHGDRLVISPSAAWWPDETLAYVLRHELAHVWQAATGDPEARRRDLDGIDLGSAEVDPLEAAADCLAAYWGSPTRGNGYLRCPPGGVARMGEVFARVATDGADAVVGPAPAMWLTMPVHVR